MAKSTKKKDDSKPPPFKKDGKDFKRLLKPLKSGKIKPTDKPGAVKTAHSQCFGKCSDNAFRSQCGQAKAISGVNVKGKLTMMG